MAATATHCAPLALLSALALVSCSAPTTGEACGPGFCEGCCQGDRCYPGQEAAACGQQGQACLDCAAHGLSCGPGFCVQLACRGQGQGCADGACCGGLSCEAQVCVLASAPDAGPEDGGTDAGAPDAGLPDAGGADAGAPDAGLQCAGGLALCGAACVNLQTEPTHCGDCLTACLSSEVCASGSCAPSNDCRLAPCPAGYFCDSGNGQCHPGCAATAECGANETCAPSTHQCTCAAGFHRCGGACVSDASLLSCGGACTPCAVPANATGSCAGGACGFSCNSGFHLCGGACVSDTSPQSCGGACTPCATPANASATCTAGACGFSCNTGLTACGAGCFDLRVDPAHCGLCTRTCLSTEVCSAGSCTASGDCRVTGSCPTGTYCDLSTGQCPAGCAADSQCPQPGSCNVATHVCSCAAGTNLCAGSCVACPWAGTSFGCAGAQCVATSCVSSYHVCSGDCVYSYDLNHCGSGCSPCTNSPPPHGTAACDGVACGFRCDSGYHACGTQCATNSDVATCGTSCSPCVPPANAQATCDGTACGFVCNDGFLKCGSGCCTATAVVAGASHSCARTSAGGAKCWGYNGSGELGDRTYLDQLTPVDVYGLTSGVATLSSSGHHTCVLTSAAGAKCWGWNSYGELGDGTTAVNRGAPVNVFGLTSTAAQVSGGAIHSCAVTTDGGAKCWGRGASGQLGNGFTGDRLGPVDVTGLTAGVKQVAAGGGHTCALRTDGGVWCWGDNSSGEVGRPASTTQYDTPQSVVGLPSGVVALATGGYHTCALTDAGAVRCWGDNFSGQLGDGTTTSRPTPAAVSGLSAGVVEVSAGYAHTCAVVADGGVLCWGSNTSGQLGDGTTTGRPLPTTVSGLAAGAAHVATGWYHSCAVIVDGGVRCWGANSRGQLGDGTTTPRLTPAEVSGR